MSPEPQSRSTIERVREAERFMAAVVDSSGDAIIAKDLNGIILEMDTKRDLFYTSQELGRNLWGKTLPFLLLTQGRSVSCILGLLTSQQAVEKEQ